MSNNGDYKTTIKKARRDMERLIVVVKATGGYKYRERIRLSDREIDRLMASCEQRLLDMAHRLAVAERMLKEPPSSYHSRWWEYQQRLKEAMS